MYEAPDRYKRMISARLPDGESIGLSQEASLRETLQELPSTLHESQKTLAKVDAMASVLGPTLEALRPGARALGPTR